MSLYDNFIQQCIDNSPYVQTDDPFVTTRVRMLCDAGVIKNDRSREQLKAGELYDLTTLQLKTIEGKWERILK